MTLFDVYYIQILIRILQNTIIPNLVICLIILRFALFRPRDPPNRGFQFTYLYMKRHVVGIETIFTVEIKNNQVPSYKFYPACRGIFMCVINVTYPLWSNHHHHVLIDMNKQIFLKQISNCCLNNQRATLWDIDFQQNQLELYFV